MPIRRVANKMAVTVALSLSLATAVNAETLKQAVEETVDSNPDVLIAAKTRLANTEVYKQARAGYFPTVDVNAGYGRQRSKNPTVAARLGKNDYDTLTRKESGLAINQLIFDGFGTPSEVARRRADVQANAYEVAAVAQDLGLEAVNAYLNVLRHSELVSLAKANVSAHRRTFNMIKSRSDSGLNREADVDQATGRLALAKANLQARQSDYRDAKIEYLRVIGRVPQDVQYKYVPMVSVPNSQEQVVALATANHPRIHQAKYDIEEAQSSYYVSRSLFWPRVDAQLGGNWNRNMGGSKGTDNDYYAMLRLQYNLFNGGGDLARVRESRYIMQRAQEYYNLAERQVSESARLSWNDYRTSKARLGELKQHRDSAKTTLNSYRKQFKLGKRSLLDLLDSENEVFDASNAYVTEKYTELFARYRILNSMGTLLQTLGVPLPVEAYDEFADSRHHPVGSSKIKHARPHAHPHKGQDDIFLGPVYSSKAAPSSSMMAKAKPATTNAAAATTTVASATSATATATVEQPGVWAGPAPTQYASAKNVVRQQQPKAKTKAVRSRNKRMSQQQIARIQQNQERAAQQFAIAQAQQQRFTDAELAQPAKPIQPKAQQQWKPIANNVKIASKQSTHSGAGETWASSFTDKFKQAQTANQWNVQIATFSNPDNAKRLQAKLNDGGYKTFVRQSQRNGKTYSHVMVAPSDRHAGKIGAEQVMTQLEDEYQMRGFVTDKG